jgi:hypothetical protein
LPDKTSRDHLESLATESSGEDALWQEARRISHDFRDALLDVFFDRQSGLYDLTGMYGVF